MKKIQVYDPVLRCQTGVCGSFVDPSLGEFSAGADRARNREGENSLFFLCEVTRRRGNRSRRPVG